MNFLIFAIFCSIAALAFAQNTLGPGGQLDSDTGDNVRFSPNQQYKLVMQGDGNLVIYRVSDGNYVWATQTIGSGANKAAMQSDGQFCLYNEPGELKWSTYTRDAGSVLRLQDDGNLVVYNPNGTPVWNAFTGYGKKTTV
jgi:hypothetical protein